jgi:nitroreductase
LSFFDLIESRHSIRTFEDKKLDYNIIEKIASAAMRAASAGNLQSYQIFIVTKKEDKVTLASAAHGQDFIVHASVVFVFCADTETAAQDYGKRGQDLYCIQDATIACTYAQLAAHALGLASVWVGSFDEESVIEILGLRPNLRPITMLVVGFAAEEPEITPRKPMDQMVHKL